MNIVSHTLSHPNWGTHCKSAQVSSGTCPRGAPGCRNPCLTQCLQLWSGTAQNPGNKTIVIFSILGYSDEIVKHYYPRVLLEEEKILKIVYLLFHSFWAHNIKKNGKQIHNYADKCRDQPEHI